MTKTTAMAWAMAGAITAAAAETPVREYRAGETIHGFTVKSVTALPDLGGRMVRMEFAQNGADLVWIDRNEENMSFAIGFRTIPEDDTGLPHILEHSVLCGSKKYPVKEPFVELLKGSFATFLNAWTMPDCTTYPVCSRNRTDFLNLIDVYLDAVFHPLSVESPLPFRQEGWHWELDEAGKLVRNGVVYNEMKGVFTSIDRQAYYAAMRLLFPDNCYKYVSGGDPASIPNLTFEQYKAFHRKYYHPSNARIYLDGHVDLPAVLAKLEGELKLYGRAAPAAPVPLQKAVSGSTVKEYELGADENPADKTMLAEGWVVAKFDEIEKHKAIEVLADVLAGSNEDALTKALLQAGLCEDVRISMAGSEQVVALLTLKNVKDGKVAEARALVERILRDLAEKGLDRTRLAAVIDRHEFDYREKDQGNIPTGLALLFDAYEVWLYGGDPADAFRAGSAFAKLREGAANGMFERLLREAFVENPHRARVELKPNPGLGEVHAKAEREALDKIWAGWSEEQRARVKAEAEELKAHQHKDDSPEDLAKLPSIALKDIPVEGPVPQIAETQTGGVKMLRVKTAASGIAYLELYFSVDDFTLEELSDLAMAAGLIGELATARRDAIALKNAMDAGLGRFEVSVRAYGVPGNRAAPYLVAKVSALESKQSAVAELVSEALAETAFADARRIGDLLKQRQRAMERGALGIEGRLLAQRRAEAALSARGAANEWIAGIEHLRRLQRVNAEFAQNGAAQCARLGELVKRAVGRKRLTAGLSDNVPAEWAAPLFAKLPEGEKGAALPIAPMRARREGFVTAGRGGAAAKGGIIAPYTGAGVVAARLLSLDHLWTEVRVKGGAYGGAFQMRPHGEAWYLSWNDPQPDRSLGCYDASGAALRRVAAAAEGIDRYVVSAVAKTEPYLTPAAETTRAMEIALSGRTAADLQRTRREMLETTPEQLVAFSRELDRIAETAPVCVVGGAEQVEKCRKAGAIDSAEPVVQ